MASRSETIGRVRFMVDATLLGQTRSSGANAAKGRWRRQAHRLPAGRVASSCRDDRAGGASVGDGRAVR